MIKKNQIDQNFPLYKKFFVPIPNIFLRSSIFGIIKKGNRLYEKNINKYSFYNSEIIFTGENFDQSDFDIFLGLIYLYQISNDNICKFSIYKFLKLIKRSCGKNDSIWLKKSLLRMQCSVLKIYFFNKKKKYSYSGNLIIDLYQDEIKNLNFVKMNDKLLLFFFSYGWTYINVFQRLKLKGKPLSQWLYNFYSSYNFFPVKIKKLKVLTGSKTKIYKKFKQMINKSLFDIFTLIGWNFKIGVNDTLIIDKFK